jgi:uncharacterized protein involved in outer membrane biogenesis
MKKLLIILGVVVVLLAGAVAILVANLDKVVNSRKDYILAKAESALGRDVNIDDIGVTLRGGIGVKLSTVTVSDEPDFSEAPFVTAKDLTVRVKLWPLIRKQVEVKRLVLNEPVINVIRDEQGVFNFAGIARSAAQPQTEGVEARGSSGAAEPAAAATLALAFVDIEDGTLRYSDLQKKLELQVKRIDFTAKNAALGQEASIDFKAAVLADEQNVRLEGTVGPVERLGAAEDLKPTPVQLKATLGPFTADQLKPLLAGSTAVQQLERLGTGTIGASLEVTGTLGALELAGADLDAAVLGASEPNLTVHARTKPFDATAVAEGVPSVGFNGKLTLKPLPLGRLPRLAGGGGSGGGAQAVPALELAGDGGVDVAFDGTPSEIALDASVDVTGGSVRYGDRFAKPSGVPAQLSAKISMTPAAARIERCTVEVGDLELEASGNVGLSGASPDVDLSFRSGPTDIAAVSGMLPSLQPFSPGGTLELVGSASGALAPGSVPDVRGTLTLKDGSAKLEQMPQPVTAAAATVTFTDNTAQVKNATATVGKSKVRLAAAAKSFRPLDATYHVSSGEVFRADFNAPTAPGSRPEVLRDVDVQGRVWGEGEAVHLEGAATSSAGTLADMDYRDMKASIGSTQDRIEIRDFSAKTMGGTVQGNGAFLPKETPPRFEVTTRIRSVNLAEYFTYKVKTLPRFIEGTIDLDLNLAGAGKGWEEIRPTLTGDGGGVVVKGALLDVNIANELLYGLTQLPLVDPSGVDRFRARHPKLFSGNKTAFKDLKGQVRIEGGRIHSKGLVLDTPEFAVYGDGWVSMDRQMDIKTNIVVSPQTVQALSRDVSVVQYLTNDKGQLEIPISLSGSFTKIRYAPDMNALSRKIRDAGVNKLREEAEGRVTDFLKGLGKKSDAKPDTSKGR